MYIYNGEKFVDLDYWKMDTFRNIYFIAKWTWCVIVLVTFAEGLDHNHFLESFKLRPCSFTYMRGLCREMLKSYKTRYNFRGSSKSRARDKLTHQGRKISWIVWLERNRGRCVEGALYDLRRISGWIAPGS